MGGVEIGGVSGPGREVVGSGGGDGGGGAWMIGVKPVMTSHKKGGFLIHGGDG